MQDVADQTVVPTTIGADLWAIFISLELSRSTWLATSLSPGSGEKMSKHSVSAGDIAGLQHLKAQVCRELDRLELLLEQIKAVEAERDALLNAEQTKASARPPMLPWHWA
jgi:hypothetical protein